MASLPGTMRHFHVYSKGKLSASDLLNPKYLFSTIALSKILIYTWILYIFSVINMPFFFKFPISQKQWGYHSSAE